jgi:serine-type D-Ala-D-Ala carboxypeptidase (penicillin-binding protein 5/6)
MTSRKPPEQEPKDEHRVIAFAAVALVVLGSLLVLARLASGAEEAPGLQGAEGPPSMVNVSSASGPFMASVPGPQQVFKAPLPFPQPPAIGGASFAVLERSCGALLFGRNEHQRLPPASLTKIITAMVVEERGDLNDVVETNVSAKQMARRGSSVMGLEPRMHPSVQDLLYGLFLPSGNDAAVTLAQYVGRGNVDAFVNLMNLEAARLNLRNTHFTNPHGLDDPGLFSSAYDMALAGKALLDDPLLAKVSTTPEYTVPAAATNTGPIVMKNGNRMLQMYPGSLGVKIGFTDDARQTIVAAAERNGRQLIVSVFGSEDRYEDAVALFDWAFTNVPTGC